MHKMKQNSGSAVCKQTNQTKSSFQGKCRPSQASEKSLATDNEILRDMHY